MGSCVGLAHHRRRDLVHPLTMSLLTMARWLAGHVLIYLCAVIDLATWYEEGRWYRYGQRGCVIGLAGKGFELLEKQRDAG